VSSTGSLPGATLVYNIFYENDGSAATEDTVNIVDMLPRGVMYLDTVSCWMDSGITHVGSDKVDVDYWYRPDSAWLENLPGTPNTDGYFDTLNAITGVRFQIPAGIGRNDTTDDAGTDTKTGILGDGDSLDKDAGYVTFKVRIR
jgi:hypothetical protein